MSNGAQPYERLLIKLSGEVLSGPEQFGINQKACRAIAESLKKVQEAGIQTAIVIGGGNIVRGINLTEMGLEQTPADHMGMLATMINGIALQQALKAIGAPARVMSALQCPKVADAYNWNGALASLEKGEILIFVGGTGNPYFTTDTAAALRANEIHADIILKATKVNGIYDKDPKHHPDAKQFSTLTYSEMLAKKLRVMDATSIALCRSNDLPILVFNMEILLNNQILDMLAKKDRGTFVSGT